MTEQTQPPQAPKRGLDSHPPSTTHPRDIKARPDPLKAYTYPPSLPHRKFS
ncbi:hypothetical protein PGTUg99_003971 [Puccinia graminis f. sp. tritici]|uniref:Uncharacterized protein n=1 Tax=Puccinia graminis f. sp. tritici TaxID=56615 RepID=A0A5B0S3J3_PUCGR|nr:hypothetical protein PGTUg99_003971 [Puccinia graminis f. sp. tritici]